MEITKKYLICCFGLVSISLNGFSQQHDSNQKITKSQLPKAVWQAYLSQNSGGQLDTVWQKEFVPIYKVNFTSGNKKLTASYTHDGNWINTLEKIELADLPVSVINQVSTKYAGFEITNCQIELSNNGKLYAITLTKADKTVVDYYQMDGRSVNKY